MLVYAGAGVTMPTDKAFLYVKRVLETTIGPGVTTTFE
jgi:hypothetical protein